MSVVISVNATGIAEVQRALRAASPKQADRWVREYLTRSMLLILDNAARKQIRRGGAIAGVGPRGGRTITAAPPLPVSQSCSATR